MRCKYHKILWDMFLLVFSYNRPKLDSNAVWNPNATIFIVLNSSFIASPPGVFVNFNNTVFITDPVGTCIQGWPEGSSIPTRNIDTSWIYEYSIFVTTNEDVYIVGYTVIIWPPSLTSTIYKWIKNSSAPVVIMSTSPICSELFIDLNSTLYCSSSYSHQVFAGSLISGVLVLSTVAGTGSPGSGSVNFSSPRGIFVDEHFSLYVADSGNDRVQFFIRGRSNGSTVAGIGAPGTIILDSPSDVVLDADGYMFIADTNHNRIVGSGPYGFRCVAGCSTLSGATADQLNQPYMLAFDTYGNMFVSDRGNHRIQNFLLRNDARGTYEK